MPASRIDEATLRDILAANALGPLFDEAWTCNPVSAVADILASHNEARAAQGQAVADKFKNPQPIPCRLRELLWRDYEFLAMGEPSLRSPKGCYILEEVSGPKPHSEYIKLEVEGVLHHVILFHSPLLYFVHSAFSKIITMLEIEPDVLPEHRRMLSETAYSDVSLLAALLNDIEIFFNSAAIRTELAPPHLVSPYDFCEFIDGARRFLLAHEIGHAHFHETEDSDYTKMLFMENMSLDQDTAAAWTEELWCDQFAILTILDIYEDCHSRGELTGELQFEFENALNGIILLFAVLELAEIAVEGDRQSTPTHPPYDFRLAVLRGLIKEHSLYPKLPGLPASLQGAWMRLKAFRSLQPFTTLGPMATYLACDIDRNPLTEFGRRAYKAITSRGLWTSGNTLGWGNGESDGYMF
jgi:hypothetical protein